MNHAQTVLTLAIFMAALLAGIAFAYFEVRRGRAAHEQLALSEERFRLLAQSIVDYAMFALDPNGRVITWNAGAQRIKGYSENEIVGSHFSRFYTKEDIEHGKPQRALNVAAVEGRFEEEGWRVRKDGTQFWASVVITAIRDAAGALRGFAKVTRDLTERRRLDEAIRSEIEERRKIEQQIKELNQSLERQVAARTADFEAANEGLRNAVAELQRADSTLRDTQGRLTRIIDSAMDAIVTVDENQHIVVFNAAAEKIFGCPQKDALGAPLARFIPQRYRDSHAVHIEQFGRTGTTSRPMGGQRIVMGLRQNGEEFPIEASISQVEQSGKRFYTVILRDITARVLAEERLRESRAELHELASTAQTAREQEKSRIARELHDELGQLLASLRLDIEVLKVEIDNTDQLARLGAMTALLDRSMAETRRIASDLRPLILDDLGLVPAIEWLIDTFRSRTGIACRLTILPPDLDLADPHATAIYRIVQESLTNVAKHAQASFVDVKLTQHQSEIVLTIRDNGRGFEPRDPRKPLSFGLVGLRERAYFVGGRISVESTPDYGTTITARIPFPVPAAA